MRRFVQQRTINRNVNVLPSNAITDRGPSNAIDLAANRSELALNLQRIGPGMFVPMRDHIDVIGLIVSSAR